MPKGKKTKINLKKYKASANAAAAKLTATPAPTAAETSAGNRRELGAFHLNQNGRTVDRLRERQRRWRRRNDGGGDGDGKTDVTVNKKCQPSACSASIQRAPLNGNGPVPRSLANFLSTNKN